MRNIFEALFITIGVIVIIVAAIVITTYLLCPLSCDASTAEIGFPHRWSYWGGCQIQVEEGRWIPLGNYQWEEKKK